MPQLPQRCGTAQPSPVHMHSYFDRSCLSVNKYGTRSATSHVVPAGHSPLIRYKHHHHHHRAPSSSCRMFVAADRRMLRPSAF